MATNYTNARFNCKLNGLTVMGLAVSDVLTENNDYAGINRKGNK